MENYFLSLKPLVRGDYLIHKEGCPFIPGIANRIKIGEFDSPFVALTASVVNFGKATLCPYCSKIPNRDIVAEFGKDIAVKSIPSSQTLDKVFFAGIN